MFQDSGPIEYFLRGSVVLLGLVYGSFFFFWRCLLATSDGYWLFLIILAFELGFTSLANYRALYLLPFFVVYLNWLRRAETGGPSPSN
jgi:hypothetical protein